MLAVCTRLNMSCGGGVGTSKALTNVNLSWLAGRGGALGSSGRRGELGGFEQNCPIGTIFRHLKPARPSMWVHAHQKAYGGYYWGGTPGALKDWEGGGGLDALLKN